ncbi:MAG: dihydropteroate synthase [Deltaproteobacteria bacterium]|nr:dihydropteroate synthase [Deltaproteobacteria bacterium]
MRYKLICRDKEMILGQRTHIMGILNVTPDSFYDGGRYSKLYDALKQTEKMISEGADIIDIGGESTRPGSFGVSEKEELNRVIPVIKEVMKRFDIVLSIDTTKAKVAEEALSQGVSIVNDISGLKFDPRIAEVVARYRAGLVLMHTTSRPHDMQNKTEYNSIVHDIVQSLRGSVKLAEEKGVHSESIVIDPGFGFGKTPDQNLMLLKHLRELLVLEKPILIGTSRKSFIGRVLGGSQLPEEKLAGTAATISIAIMNHASIVRVHDVFYMKNVALMTDAVLNVN